MRSLFRPFLVLACLLATGAVQAQVPTAYLHHVLLDTDNNSATGCDVAVEDKNISTTVHGIDQVVTMHVDTSTNPPQVTEVTRQACAGGSFGAAHVVDSTGWNVGLGDGTNGGNVIEGYVKRADIGDPSQMRVAFFSTTAAATSDVLLTTDGSAQGDPIVVNLNAAAIPTLSQWAMIVTALLLAGLAFRFLRGRMAHGLAVLVALVVGIGGAGTAKAVTAIMDGQVSDWAGIAPVGTDPSGDTSDDNSAEDIVAGFVTWDTTNVYFRVDVDICPPGTIPGPDGGCIYP